MTQPGSTPATALLTTPQGQQISGDISPTWLSETVNHVLSEYANHLVGRPGPSADGKIVLVKPSHGWERNKAQTRLALANAAVRLFRARGYNATTVDDIAEEAGCSARTFFRYFGAKEDVLFVNTGEMVEDFQRLIANPVPGLTRWDQIRDGISTTIRKIADPNSGIAEITIATWLSEPAIAKRFSQVTAELERAWS